MMPIAASLIAILMTVEAGGAPATRGSERVIHRFDFDERKEGNLEEHPKYWERVESADFPVFTTAGFAFDVGHSAPPSFHLGSEGRDVAFAYMGPAARVQAGRRFRIEGFIRPDRLVHARACLSAAYRRSDGSTLLETLVRSSYISGEDGRWQRVELYLPQAPADAEAIVLTTWVLQESTWNGENRSARAIDQVDVVGGAWFDDIVVVALPRIDVRVADGLNVITPDARAELQVIVDDEKLHELDLRLSVKDAAGRLQREAQLKKSDFVRGASSLSLAGLAPGVYRATLRATFEDQLIDARSTRFAILAPLPEGRRTGNPEFGIVMQPGDRLSPLDAVHLLGHQFVRAVKVPVETASTSSGAVGGDADSELFLELMKRGFDITAILLPPRESSTGRISGSIIEAMARDPSHWEAGVSTTAARYAGAFRWWQLGNDGAPLGDSAGALEPAVIQVRDVLDRYALGAHLTATWSMHEEFGAGNPQIDGATVTVDTVSEPVIAGMIEEQHRRGVQQVSAFVPPLPDDDYARLPRLSEWAKRVLLARHAGASSVYVPQTWVVRPSYEGLMSEPSEEFVLLRTLSALIAGAEPGPMVRIGDSVQCLSFLSGESAVLALWDDDAPPEGRETMLQLGRATEVIDLWGNREPLEPSEDGRREVALSPMPVFVQGVEPWLINLMTGVSLQPSRAAPGAEAARHVLKIDYGGEKSLTATLRLQVPDGWRASPPAFEASLSPGASFAMPFELRRPHNEPSGVREILAEMELDSPRYMLEIPIPFEIALEDLEVRGWALLVGDDLVLRHSVRNTGAQQLHLRSAAAVPGRQRQYRPIVNLDPGKSETVEYHFRDAADLSERQVYLTLRELNDGPRSHTLQVTVP